MTLEEMGLDYLRQAEELRPGIEERKKMLSNHNLPPKNWLKLNHEIVVLEDIINSLETQGYQLLNYYKKGGGNNDKDGTA